MAIIKYIHKQTKERKKIFTYLYFHSGKVIWWFVYWSWYG